MPSALSGNVLLPAEDEALDAEAPNGDAACEVSAVLRLAGVAVAALRVESSESEASHHQPIEAPTHITASAASPVNFMTSRAF
ncbi:MAG: hypothetical protein HC858_01780 [Brachymonas sp.]|nr:hypothetical protein [Brachymonas sp.]NJS36445.1 hypothetical protein [Brachymonas sp.]